MEEFTVFPIDFQISDGQIPEAPVGKLSSIVKLQQQNRTSVTDKLIEGATEGAIKGCN